MVESEASPRLFTLVGPTMPISIRKKQEKKGGGGGGSQSSPTIGEAPLPTYAQKHKKEKKRRRMGACLSWSSRWISHNFKCSCSSFLGSLLLKLMFQALLAFHLLSIPSSKLSKLTLNHKPKCWSYHDGVSVREVEGGGVSKIEEVDRRKGGR